MSAYQPRAGALCGAGFSTVVYYLTAAARLLKVPMPSDVTVGHSRTQRPCDPRCTHERVCLCYCIFLHDE